MLLRGIALRDHPMKRYRGVLREKGILDSQEVARCPAWRHVKVAGMMLVHQAPPTAKGVHFVTLGDEHELFITIVVRHYIRVRYERALWESRLLIVDGTVER
jgi:DNA polymerase III alpha subunit